MSETIKHMVPRTRWTKWTGSNLTELQNYWEDVLAESGVTLSEDNTTNELVASSEGYFGAFATRVPPGTWLSLPGMRTSEEELTRTWTEIPATGLMPT